MEETLRFKKIALASLVIATAILIATTVSYATNSFPFEGNRQDDVFETPALENTGTFLGSAWVIMSLCWIGLCFRNLLFGER